MAIWQYTCILIPLRNFENNYIKFLQQEKTDYRKETHYFWNNFSLSKSVVSEKIDLNISKYKSENENRIYWKGDSDNFEDNDCEIQSNNDFITEFTIRFDLRNAKNVKKFIDLLLEISIENQLKFMNLKYEFFNAEKNLLIEDIKNSNGMKFLENPEEFLNSLSQS